MTSKNDRVSDSAWMSFGAQAMHYFNRPHHAVRRTPVEGAAAWRGVALRERYWKVGLDATAVNEIDAAVRSARAAGIAMGAMRRGDFPLPTVGPRLRAWARALDSGRGFLLLRGLPVERWGDDDSALAFWGIGQHLGRPGAQNPQGDLLGHVVDTGEDAANPFVRRYRTAGDIAFHCDLADVVGLLCLRSASRGGASRLVSSVSVYNELLRRRPDLIERLYEPFLLDNRDEQRSEAPAFVPVSPCRYADGRLRTFYHSDYFRSVERHPEAPRFTDLERELLDLYESIANDPDLYLDMALQPGDVQLVSNHSVLHARTAYTDTAVSQRHLLRLWLSLD